MDPVLVDVQAGVDLEGVDLHPPPPPRLDGLGKDRHLPTRGRPWAPPTPGRRWEVELEDLEVLRNLKAPVLEGLLAPMVQEVWEVAALWLQNPSLGERTAHLGGELLGRQHLDMEQAGEPLFPVELASRTRICLQFHASIKMSPGIKAKGSPRRHLDLE